MDFILELAQLVKTTPKLCLPTDQCENSPYNSFLFHSKGCYLCFSSGFLDSCFYLDTASHDKDAMDSAFINHCELCYECVDSTQCYNCNFCQDCKNCTDCNFCYDCQGCTNCFGCVGLRKKEYYIFNERYSKEDYAEKVRALRAMPQADIEEKMTALRLKYAHPPMHLVGCENVLGDYVYNSKNCFMAFHAEKSEDCMYVYDEISGLKDCVDCTHIQDCQLCYGLMSAFNCYNVDSSWWAVDSTDCKYGMCILQCKNCFGCVNLKRKEFHILNKPYSKENYFKKVAEIEDDLRAKGLYGKYLLMDAVELARAM